MAGMLLWSREPSDPLPVHTVENKREMNRRVVLHCIAYTNYTTKKGKWSTSWI